MRNRTVLWIALLALLLALGFAPAASAQRALGQAGKAGEWVVMTYVPDNNYSVPVPLAVTPVKGNGVSFDFYPTPDRAMLLYDTAGQKQFAPGKLVGRTLSARIAIQAPAGTEFLYFNNDGGGSLQGGWADPGGFVRLYFYGPNPALIDCPSGWHPERPDCEAQYWWSNPVHIDLEDLAALGTKGITLEVPLRPEFWSDRDGHMGDSDADHLAWFGAVVANLAKFGLSFGGNGWWAFGAGFNADVGPGPVWFVLNKFVVK
jgi:hypothetical protein